MDDLRQEVPRGTMTGWGSSVGLWVLGVLACGCSSGRASSDAAVGSDGHAPTMGDARANEAGDLPSGADAETAADTLDAASSDLTEAATNTFDDAGPDREADATEARDAAGFDRGPLASLDGASDLASQETRPETAESVPGEDGAPKDGIDDRPNAGDAFTASEIGGETPTPSGCDDPAGCAGSNWAHWPMPNTAADVANGAPNPTVLVDNGDDTVSDQVTGLMWQRSATVTRYTRGEAQARCAKLRTGGYADWRMPSAIELVSIIDFDKSNPSVDALIFPDTPLDLTSNPQAPVGYEVTTSVAGDPLAGWLVDFAFGRVSLDTTSLDRPAFVRCVRGPRAPADDSSAGRYDLSAAGTALDTKTGLTWQRTAPGSRRTLADAQAYCATGTGLPGSGWRVPTIKELLTLVDFAKPASFRIDETVFNAPTAVSDPYSVLWSATSVVGKPAYAQFTYGTWSVYFDKGQNYYIDAAGQAFVRCVR